MRARGLVADFVVVNEQASSYVQDLQQAIESLCENSRLRGKELGPRQHIFAVRRDLMDETILQDAARRRARRAAHPQRHHLRPDRARRGGRLAGARRLAAGRMPAHCARLPAPAAHALPRRPSSMSAPTAAGLSQWNGFGGFDGDGRDYVVRLAGRRTTPQPWINVISNASFGFHTSAEGAVLHLEPQQPRLPADAVVERPGHQPAGRGDLHLRPGQRQGVLAVRRRGARSLDDLRGAARPGLLAPSAPSAGRCRWN